MDKKYILIIDNLIPKFLQEQVETVIPHLPLRFGHRGLGYNEGYNTFSEQWSREVQHGVEVSHTNFLADMPWELKAMWTVVHHARASIFKNVNDSLILNQVQINLTTEEHFGGKHTDAPDDSEQMKDPNWIPSHTMVYFVQGDTGIQFWNNNEVIHSVDFKKGRCVLFPSSYIHEGLKPNKISPRVTIGFIFNGLPLQINT